MHPSIGPQCLILECVINHPALSYMYVISWSRDPNQRPRQMHGDMVSCFQCIGSSVRSETNECTTWDVLQIFPSTADFPDSPLSPMFILSDFVHILRTCISGGWLKFPVHLELSYFIENNISGKETAAISVSY